MFNIQEELKKLPQSPGIYMMKNNADEIIYVGKAKNLNNRVHSYFRESSQKTSEKVRSLVAHIEEFEYIITDSEKEALLLECNLIKKYRPKYNILLKDDKNYPYIKITMNEDFPRLIFTRNIAKDGCEYYGPFSEIGAVYETLTLLRKLYPLRTCKRYINEKGEKVRPCLNYQIGLCKAPCAGLISKDEYDMYIKEAKNLLMGKNKDILEDLNKEMLKESENLNYELAAVYRDKIIAVKKIMERQKMISGSPEDEDFINIFSDENDSCIQVFFLREGKIVGREHFIVENTSDILSKDIITSFFKQFYGGTAYIPKNIYIPCEIEEAELFSQILSAKRENKVYIKIPQKGEKRDVLEFVYKNAKITMEKFKTKLIVDKEMHLKSLEELSELLELDNIPNRIEAFDISNIQGVDSVGSLVVFEDGKNKNSDYRRFKINENIGNNDYESIREVVTRRFKHGLDEIEKIQKNQLEYSQGKFSVFPDLIMMDGGKGQVNIAIEVLDKLNIKIPICGMVKDENHETRGIIYNGIEINIKGYKNAMNLVTRIQDEVHRFAISYHRTLRDKRILHSILEDIPFIGATRRKELLLRFGSVDNIKKASLEELIKTKSIDKKAANSIIEFFK
ncbi:MAG: excinuclease ABC subunit UvrC [Oscillospiraceae bacterium]|nr:excinuclease ABC subunit UvrC [Oscillospiraceae bacterium]